jgi:signal transduction histidine kinase
LDVRNPGTVSGATDLTMRLGIAGPGGASAFGDVYITDGISVPRDNQWEFNLGLGLGSPTRDDFIAHIKAEGRIRDFERELDHPSGDKRHILASIQYIELEEGEALISTFIDITDRVAAERRIRELASSLTRAEQEERYQLSRVLHDDLQQRLFAIQMHLSFLRDAYEKNDLQAVAGDFPQMEEWLREAINTTRALSMDIDPPILHGEGLREAVLWLAAHKKDQYSLDVNVQTSGIPVQLDENLRVVLFQAIRELLFNVVKHSNSLEAVVTIEYKHDRVSVTVSDQGDGFDANSLMSTKLMGHGLHSIRHRLNLMDCSMAIDSAPGQGTRITIEAPIQPPEA